MVNKIYTYSYFLSSNGLKISSREESREIESHSRKWKHFNIPGELFSQAVGTIRREYDNYKLSHFIGGPGSSIYDLEESEILDRHITEENPAIYLIRGGLVEIRGILLHGRSKIASGGWRDTYSGELNTRFKIYHERKAGLDKIASELNLPTVPTAKDFNERF